MRPMLRARATFLFLQAVFAFAMAPLTSTSAHAAVNAEDAAAFVDEAEATLLQLWINQERTHWVKATNITHDTEILAAQADEAVMKFVAETSAAATRFDGLDLAPDVARKLHLLKIATMLPAPRDAAKRAELAKTATFLSSTYGKGSYCSSARKGECLKLDEMYGIMAKSRDYDELLDLWQGWRKVSVPMRDKFARYVELANQGAAALGFKDLGELWRSGYDMSPAAFQAETDRLWQQVKPLYDELHCYTRAKLSETYGADKVPVDGAIPAHVLGNMWAQDWGNLYDLLAPEETKAAFDLDKALEDRGTDAVGMTKIAEKFFTSVGLAALPETFWERSMFTRPKDREVVCHASAWDVDWVDDLRIKMCIKIKEQDLVVIHHELGHNYYQRAYAHQPTLFRNSANDGFHEALGDTIALSVTPSYLKEIGLLAELPPDNLNPLMKRALDKVSFLPFGLLIDRWRWDVFSGKTKPAGYNSAWWALREKYQGVKAPVARADDDFDPGAKYHIPANVPYTRYFLATILQFQFHRALCRVAGHEGPLHTCSIYGNKAAGTRLNEMMKMGLSVPWPDALEALSGERQMDATAIVDYFAPLMVWLKEQNKGRQCGW